MKKITTLLLLISGIFIGSSGLNAQAADHSNANIQYSVNKISRVTKSMPAVPFTI